MQLIQPQEWGGSRIIPVSALKLIFKSCNKLCTSHIKHRVTVIPSNKS